MSNQQRITPGDPFENVMLAAVTGAIFGALLAWEFDASVGWWILATIAGSAAMVALVLIFMRSFRPLPSESLRRMTEKPTAPETSREAVAAVIHEQRIYLGFHAIRDGLLGTCCGGLIAFTMSHGWDHRLAYAVAAGVAGALIGMCLGWRLSAVPFATSVVLIRFLGLPLGYATIGAVCGALFGMELWHRWQGVRWSITGALAIGIPFALLFGLLGWHRLRQGKQR